MVDQGLSKIVGEKNDSLSKSELDSYIKAPFSDYEINDNIEFIKINGIASFWDKNKFIINRITTDILTGINKHDVSFIFTIEGDQKGISIYIGTNKYLVLSLITSLESLIPGIDIEKIDYDPVGSFGMNYGGLITGIPSIDDEEIDREINGINIDRICRAMIGRDFLIQIVAKGISPYVCNFAHHRILKEISSTHEMLKKTTTGGLQGNINVESYNYVANDYYENLMKLESDLKLGQAKGIWRYCGYYASNSVENVNALSNIIKSSYLNDNSIPEPLRTISVNKINDLIVNKSLISDFTSLYEMHPLGNWYQQSVNSYIPYFSYKYQTVINSEQLALLCSLPTEEYPGYYIHEYARFSLTRKLPSFLKEDIQLGEIIDNSFLYRNNFDNSYNFDLNDLTRHALIVGVTGSGKTNTAKSILSTLWLSKNIPFLVIESAKREYWNLKNKKGFQDLIVFTLGSEEQNNSVKYRINPFECIKGVSLQTHIDYLLSTFKAAFELYPPMPYALESAVYEVYKDKGWDITENINVYGRKAYPTLTDLYNKIDVVVNQLGYDTEVQSNVKAALKARVGSLMIGGKGAMLNTKKSIPLDNILNKPVIFELEDLGDDDIKSFVMGILLVQIYEYRKSKQESCPQNINHILMVEEAHRLLKKVAENGEANTTKAKSIEFFCDMLAEIRTYGQGIFVADQVPTKLAPDILKNTNLKIAHRIVSEDDRVIMGRSMNMTIEQIDYLSIMERGYAAVFSEGDNRPKKVLFPYVKNDYNLTRAEVIKSSNEICSHFINLEQINTNNHAGCSFCEKQCIYKEEAKKILLSNIKEKSLIEVLKKYKYNISVIKGLFTFKAINEWCSDDIDRKICIIGHALSFANKLPDGYKQKLIANYLRYDLDDK